MYSSVSPPPSSRPSVPAAAGLLAGPACAAAGGLLLYLSFPPRTLWWFAFPAVALLVGALRGVSARRGLLLGAVFGAAFLLPLLEWTGTFVGAGPWVALVALQTLFFAAAGGAVALVSRLPGAWLWTAAVWVGVEAVRARVPFGGFGWGRLGFGQADGPLLALAALGGASLVSFAVVVGAVALAAGARGAFAVVRDRRLPESARCRPAFLVVLLPIGALLGFAHPPAPASATLTVAVVQGNVPRLGLDFAAQRRAVLDNHLAQTRLLADRVRRGDTPRPDLVLWPENASDLDPVHDPAVAAEIQGVVDAVGSPTVVGAVVRGADGPRNVALLVEPGVGIVDEYDKRRLQPFGETMPLREVLRAVTPLVDRAAADFVPGTDPAPLESSVGAVGIVTCYEVLFDDAVRDTVRAGAEILAVPSNNATFGLSDMTHQALAMSRVRAVEHDRATAVAATSGVSALIAPDGTVLARTGSFEPGLLVAALPLKTGTTVATALGGPIELALSGLGAAALLGALVPVHLRLRLRRQEKPS